MAARDGKSTRIVRIASFLLVMLAGAMIVCAGVGFAVTQVDDSRLEIERQVTLRQAIEEFRAVSGDVDRIGDPQLRLIERRAGLKGLRFDSDPAGESGREVQSVIDGRGRIVGWFSWVGDRALVHAMNRLWGFAAAVGVALALCALLAARAAQRLARALDRTTETVRQLTSQDTLTGLPNHRVMLETLQEALAKRGSEVVAFALVDLDGFHEVNDTLGRAGGDAVLMSVADHLRAALPAGAAFGRFEEDEFAVITVSDDPRVLIELADCIRAALFRPVFMDRMWQITAGLGLAQAPEDGTTAEELARRASLALRAAKREGRGTAQRFAPQIEIEGAERRFLLRELESAIALQAFDVHYQPIVAADGGGVVGVEALLRWTHPTRGAIGPSVFVPLAEQSGLMSQLGEIVLRRALADGVRWPKIFVSVNLSPRQIRDRWLVDLVGAIMAETGIASSRVVLEVTEGILDSGSARNPDPARSAALARRLDRARRFRHRLFEHELSAKIPVRSTQDRPNLCRFARQLRQYRRHHPFDREPRPRVGHEGAGGRRRDRRATRAAAARRLRRDAGFPVRQAGAGRRDRPGFGAPGSRGVRISALIR